MEQQQREQLRNEYKLRPLNRNEEGLGIGDTAEQRLRVQLRSRNGDSPVRDERVITASKFRSCPMGSPTSLRSSLLPMPSGCGNETWRSRSRFTPTHMKKQTRWSASRSIGC